MDINSYNLYSSVSVNEEANSALLEEILAEFDEIRNLKNRENVKSYLKEKYSLDNNRTRFYIKKTAPVDLTETESNYVLNLKYKNENRAICYTKK